MVLPVQLRLRGYKCFDYLYKKGIRYQCSTMILRVAPSKSKFLKKQKKSMNLNSIKCAVSISHKVSKKAVTRNKLRRIFHGHLTKQLFKTSSYDWALISLKPPSAFEKPDFLLEECDKLLLKAGLLQ